MILFGNSNKSINWDKMGNTFLIKLSGRGFTAANDDVNEIHEVFPLPVNDIKIATSSMPETIFDKSEKELIEQQRLTLPVFLEQNGIKVDAKMINGKKVKTNDGRDFFVCYVPLN